MVSINWFILGISFNCIYKLHTILMQWSNTLDLGECHEEEKDMGAWKQSLEDGKSVTNEDFWYLFKSNDPTVL